MEEIYSYNIINTKIKDIASDKTVTKSPRKQGG